MTRGFRGACLQTVSCFTSFDSSHTCLILLLRHNIWHSSVWRPCPGNMHASIASMCVDCVHLIRLALPYFVRCSSCSKDLFAHGALLMQSTDVSKGHVLCRLQLLPGIMRNVAPCECLCPEQRHHCLHALCLQSCWSGLRHLAVHFWGAWQGIRPVMSPQLHSNVP